MPPGIATFLFTDVEGSTRRWETDTEAMRDALAVHDEVLRRAVAEHAGALFKHTGDGICAVFSSPSAAVNAAVAAQRHLSLPVRMGLATGEAELRDGDYFGPVLNRAARIMAAGHGGQILLDGVTAELMSGVELLGHGPRQLRDIAKPVELYQVQATGLRTEFPPLKTEDSAPGNLRAPTNSFVGREAVLSDLVEAVTTHRLVTLTGVGGVGKTRLAHEVGVRTADLFSDGVWLIELAAVTDPRALPDVVAATLGIMQQPGLSVAQSVAAALTGRRRLLIFDNCEHLLDAVAEMVDAILATSPTVKILATSREGLLAVGEQLWPVPSLTTGAGSAAVRLFCDRALAIAPGVPLDSPAQASAVVEICERLDGIPLAIELAASRMQSMTVAEIRDRLDHRFRLLVGSRRGLERHQTLHQTVAWSYELLSAAEQVVLERCSVFAGGFGLADAAAVATDGDEFTALDVLDALVRKSLVVADRAGGRTRYSMLETIRQFAEELLAARGSAEECRAAHAAHYAAMETDVMALWDSPRQREAYEWFAANLANLRAAFRWATDEQDLDTAAAIAFYTSMLGCLTEQSEPTGWAAELIEPALEVGHPRLAQLFVGAAQCYATGRLDDAMRYAVTGEAIIESGDFDPVPFGFEAALYAGHSMAGRPLEAARYVHNVIARRPHTLAQVCLVLALANASAYDEARTAADGLLEAAETTGNPNTKVLALTAYGWSHFATDPAVAYDMQKRALALAQDSGNRFNEATAIIGLSRLAVIGGRAAEALELLTHVLHSFYDSGGYELIRGPLTLLAIAFDRLGRYEPAAVLLGFAADPVPITTFVEAESVVAHVRDSLGESAYRSLLRRGKGMAHAEAVTYAFDQICYARSALTADKGDADG
ncbi:adenylate/guanylate cyclase domain-containing protein [Mycobacterium sp. TNTM28]|uniref:Adenylate/guanylate cyclase domain-containing protein n=2 Tax=[Mycobacterium] fortunisiensis TaxID=2600579 RepID=A0ABS6KFQ8_9MYCO|nr:adenylate/guanylate cyclase domain-containing protein [[Mycobacterium] fortunisiensis]